MSIFDEFCGLANKYNKPNPDSKTIVKEAVSGLVAKLTDADTVKIKPTTAYVGVGKPSDLKPGELYVDNSTGHLFVGDGPTFGPADIPVVIGGPDSLRTVMDGKTQKSAIDDIFNTLTTTTAYVQSNRTHELKDLNTKDLMFIKDKIEKGYSYIKIKNLDELKQAFKRLGCYISDSDVSTIATVGVFELECGKYVVIN